MNYQWERARRRAFEILKNSGEFSMQELTSIISTGKDLRDQFAMAALTSGLCDSSSERACAMSAYNIADAMMKERVGDDSQNG